MESQQKQAPGTETQEVMANQHRLATPNIKPNTNNNNYTNNNNNNNNNKQKKRTFKNAIKSLIMLLNVGQKSRPQNKKQIKRVSLSVLVLGRQGTGKTSLIKTLIGDEFTSEYCPTILDVYTKETIIDNLCVKFEFIDIAGSHSFPAMRKLYIEKANIFLLVYDKNRESLDELVRLKSEIEQVRQTHISELSVAVIKSRCDIVDPQVSSSTSPSMRRSRRSRKKNISEIDVGNTSLSIRFKTDMNSSSSLSGSLLSEKQSRQSHRRCDGKTFIENDGENTSDSITIQRCNGKTLLEQEKEENNYEFTKMRQSRRSQRIRKTSLEQDEEMISRWCGTIFKCSSKLGTNVAEVDEYLLSEGSFADTDNNNTITSSTSTSSSTRSSNNGDTSTTTTTTSFSRHAKHRVSGRYIYGGRRNSRSIVLNRSPLDGRLNGDDDQQ